MTTYEAVLNLPPRGSSPNRSGHWAKHSGERAQYRGDCAAIFRHLFKEPFPSRITVHVSFYMGKTILEKRGVPSNLYRPRDVDNAIASMKQVFDAMKDACVILNDTAEHLTLGGVRLYRTEAEHKGRCGLLLRIEVDE